MNQTWEHRFIELAQLVSSWSKDPSTQCGAVIVDQKKRVVSVGFNGFPQGIEDYPSRLDDREIKYDLVLHAEVNALLFAKKDLTGCTLFVYPMPPCIRCAVQIIQSGITEVISVKPTKEMESRWGESISKTAAFLAEGGVNFKYLKETS